ncbi:hypothetical protein [Actinophytocola oryzae]|uniref:Asparagine synthase n=1 Tax=Actinophytocola oryzae TaxID=502181 RepID=A0A4R7VL79_9PSEU|nr:hypothetical protein [Actinophytocola oryzae]TDV49947.1 hypothetical protein CLV71_107295 [Actinophytocola oryzae]
MSTVANLAPTTPACEHGGRPTGFSATFDPTRPASAVTVGYSCGCRRPVDAPVTISPFRSASPLTTTTCDPARRTVRRGPLATVPVFYTRTDNGVVHVGTALSRLHTDSAVSVAALGAALAGQPLPSPLTPSTDVFRLATGAALRCLDNDRGVRLHLEELDWRELLPAGFRRAEPRELLRTALVTALADSQADLVAVSGGPASTLLAALATPLPARHVSVRMPVLDRRTVAVGRFADVGLPEIDVVDGTADWAAVRDGDVPVLPEHCDPWLDRVAGEATGSVVSGYGLGLLLAAAGRRERPRRRDLLTGEQVSPELWGRSFFRRAPAAGVHDVPPHWFGPEALAALRTAQAAAATNHLVPEGRADRWLGPLLSQLTALLDGCGLSRVDHTAGDRPAPLLPGLHPAVVGAALALAARGRSLAPVDLLPDGWRPADPPVGGRDRLFAAAYVSERLATASARADLLRRLGDGGWVRADRLAVVLAEPGARLANSWPLHRLHVLATTHRDLMTGARS